MRTVSPDQDHLSGTWLRAAALLGVALVLGACSDGSESTSPPQILNINNATEPASPVGMAIEVNGSWFLASPGEVRFSEGTNVSVVTPSDSAWSDTGIIVNVPSGGSEGSFTVPGTIAVTVVTPAGTSNAIDLELVTTPVFSVENVTWATTTALPTALRGLRAVAVPNTSTQAYVVVAGGNDGAANMDTVLSNTLAQDGTLGASWSTTTPLPATRAHHGMVAAHPANSLVAAGARYVYVIGGQEAENDTIIGQDTVFYASVATADGSVGSWSTTTALPEKLIGPSATLYNGYVYVAGGLRQDGSPGGAVYSAPVQPDGTLGSWRTVNDPLPVATSFAQVFGFGGNLYVIGGDASGSSDPNDEGLAGTNDVFFAKAWRGEVSGWNLSAPDMVMARKKHVVWVAFGQILAAEGVYNGSPGSLELERSSVLGSGNLEAWNGITATNNQIGANIYNGARLVSPIRVSGSGPRFLLLGGQAFTQTGGGAPSSAVYYNQTP